MSNLMNIGSHFDHQVKGNLQHLANLENRRDMANDQLDQQYKAQKTSNMATGAGIGYMVGAKTLGGAAATAMSPSGAAAGAKLGAMGGPVGAIAGAAIGLLATELF